MKKDRVPHDYIEALGPPTDVHYVDRVPYLYMWTVGDCCFNLEFYEDEIELGYWSIKTPYQNVDTSRMKMRMKFDYFWGRTTLDHLLTENKLDPDFAEKVIFNLDLFI